MTPNDRIRPVNSSAERDGDWVLYWMIAARRPTWNFALQRAIERATHLDKPVLVLEALRVDHPWASDRLHRFVLDGMADNASAFAGRLTYLPYVEPMVGAGRGLLEALARRACLVVTDDAPTLFLPRMIEAAGRTLDVRLEAVDTHTIVPMRSTSRTFTTAASFRRHLQGGLPGHLSQLPDPDPWRGSGRPPAHRSQPRSSRSC